MKIFFFRFVVLLTIISLVIVANFISEYKMFMFFKDYLMIVGKSSVFLILLLKTALEFTHSLLSLVIVVNFMNGGSL